MGLSKPAEARRDKLQDSLVLHRYLANVEEELAWIRDKEPLVKTDDLGRNLIGTVVDREQMHGYIRFSDNVVTMQIPEDSFNSALRASSGKIVFRLRRRSGDNRSYPHNQCRRHSTIIRTDLKHDRRMLRLVTCKYLYSFSRSTEK